MTPTALRIAQVAPPLERVPPLMYGGTERVVYELVLELHRRGHDVTLFASGDSDVPGRHIATVPRALRPDGFDGDELPYFVQTEMAVLRHAREFDIIHSHLEWLSLSLAAASPVPVVSTFHGRLDWPFARELFLGARGLVAISQSQAATHPEAHWDGVVHHGLTLRDAPFERRRSDDLCFVGRIDPEKGVLDAIEIARLSGRTLRIAAKIGRLPSQLAYYHEVFMPALEGAGAAAEFLGEVDPGIRDHLLARSYACLIPGPWPEPFGLVTIEALACGTPVIARRVGAMPEVVRDGIDGFFGDDPAQMAFQLERVGELDRLAIRRAAIDRFSPARMVDKYEAIYERRMGAFRSERDTRAARVGRHPAASGAVAGPLPAVRSIVPADRLAVRTTTAPGGDDAPQPGSAEQDEPESTTRPAG